MTGAMSWDVKNADATRWRKIRQDAFVVSMDGIDDKLSKIIKELDKRYGIHTRETAIRYLVQSYQLGTLLTKAEPK